MPNQENEVEEILLNNELILEGQRPNSTGQYAIKCFVSGPCSKSKSKDKKLYINADEDSEKFGLWKCMRCGAHGNLDKLRRQFTPPTRKEELYKSAHEIWVRALTKNKDALDYLLGRGFSEDDIAAFGYGYAEESYVEVLKKRKFTEDEMLEYGLLRRNKEDEVRPQFWDHIIIPFQRGGRYEFFQGRNLDPDAVVRYMNVARGTMPLYHAEDLYKVGRRCWLTEGAFKRDTLASFGELATGVGGTNQYDKYIADLNECQDLWIVFDADENEAGQHAAEELAKLLHRCHVVTLPRKESQKKLGVDDYLEEVSFEEFEEYANQYAVLYIDGEPQRNRNLSVIVETVTNQFYETMGRLGYDLGHERLMKLTDGPQRGGFAFVAGAPHMGKTTFLRDISNRLYRFNPNLLIDYYSHDDSMKLTVAHWIAQIAGLNSSDVRHPQVAYKKHPQMMKQWEAGVKQLQSMHDRLTILDSSFRVTLDEMYEDLCRWREDNPTADRILVIDGFSNTHFDEEKDLRDQGMVAIRRSSLMKRIAQEADIPVLSTCEIPKLYGKRPSSWDLRDSGQLEYDVDVMFTVYQEAHAKGSIDLTDMKITTTYLDNVEQINPVVEIRVAKDKMNGSTGHWDLMEFHKITSTFEELDDDDQNAFVKIIYEAEAEKSKRKK